MLRRNTPCVCGCRARRYRRSGDATPPVDDSRRASAGCGASNTSSSRKAVAHVAGSGTRRTVTTTVVPSTTSSTSASVAAVSGPRRVNAAPAASVVSPRRPGRRGSRVLFARGALRLRSALPTPPGGPCSCGSQLADEAASRPPQNYPSSRRGSCSRRECRLPVRRERSGDAPRGGIRVHGNRVAFLPPAPFGRRGTAALHGRERLAGAAMLEPPRRG